MEQLFFIDTRALSLREFIATKAGLCETEGIIFFSPGLRGGRVAGLDQPLQIRRKACLEGGIRWIGHHPIFFFFFFFVPEGNRRKGGGGKRNIGGPGRN